MRGKVGDCSTQCVHKKWSSLGSAPFSTSFTPKRPSFISIHTPAKDCDYTGIDGIQGITDRVLLSTQGIWDDCSLAEKCDPQGPLLLKLVSFAWFSELFWFHGQSMVIAQHSEWFWQHRDSEMSESFWLSHEFILFEWGELAGEAFWFWLNTNCSFWDKARASDSGSTRLNIPGLWTVEQWELLWGALKS